MKKLNSFAAAAIAGAALISNLQAAEKGSYYLWKPTPESEMRPMETDQIMSTLNPFTVDAGHFQVEMNAVRYYHADDLYFPGDSSSPIQSFSRNGWEFGALTIKAGLCNWADFEVSLRPYFQEHRHEESDYSSIPWWSGQTRYSYNETFDRSFDVVKTAFKINLWGNNGGRTALAVVPFLNIPTESDFFTGGVMVPLIVQLPWNFRLGIQAGALFYESEVFVPGRLYNGNYRFLGQREIEVIIHTGISLKRKIIGNLGAYCEFYTQYEFYNQYRDHEFWTGKINGGFTYSLGKNFIAHAGSDFGVEKGWDYSPYLGVTFRY
jgi:hypothetical protein